MSSCSLPAAPGAPARGGHRHNFSNLGSSLLPGGGAVRVSLTLLSSPPSAPRKRSLSNRSRQEQIQVDRSISARRAAAGAAAGRSVACTSAELHTQLRSQHNQPTTWRPRTRTSMVRSHARACCPARAPRRDTSARSPRSSHRRSLQTPPADIMRSARAPATPAWQGCASLLQR